MVDTSQLPKFDLINARLVNKQWEDVAASILWAELRFDLIDTDTRKLNDFLHPHPNAIFSNARKLVIAIKFPRITNVQDKLQAISNL